MPSTPLISRFAQGIRSGTEATGPANPHPLSEPLNHNGERTFWVDWTARLHEYGFQIHLFRAWGRVDKSRAFLVVGTLEYVFGRHERYIEAVGGVFHGDGDVAAVGDVRVESGVYGKSWARLRISKHIGFGCTS